MINIAGVFDLKKERKEITGLLGNIAPDNRTPVETFQVLLPFLGIKNIMHAFSNPSQQPYISDDKRYYAFAEGELTNSTAGPAPLTNLMRHFLSNDLSGWDKVNGQFVIVIYDTHDRKLHIINDRFGFRQFYYCQEGSLLVFASQIKGIMHLSQKPFTFSDRGVGEFMLFGHHFGEKTSFENIYSLPPSSILSFDGNKLELNRYWKAQYSPDDEVNEKGLGISLQNAIERQATGGGRKGLLLSGGMDSRIVASVISRKDKSAAAFTFGDRNSMDVKYAENICSILGLRHFILEFQSSKWKENIPAVVWQTEGEASFQHFNSIQFHSRMKANCDTILTGISGDMILGSFINANHFTEVSMDALADYAFNIFLEKPIEEIKKMFDADYLDHMLQLTKKSFSTSLQSNENRIAADILDSWNIENRQRRFIFVGPSSDRYLFDLRSPFYDYDFFDYSLRIPARLRYKEQLYLRTLWEAMPDLRNIPWQKTGAPPFPDRVTELRWKLKNPSNFFARHKYKKHFIDYAQLLRDAYTSEELKTILCTSGQSWHKYFNINEIDRVLDEHYGSKNHFSIISKLLTLHYVEKLFIDQNLEGLPSNDFIGAQDESSVSNSG